MRDTYIYPAIFTSDKYGYAVEFPDLPGCVTCADTEELAIKRAREVLAWHLWDRERGHEDIPSPSPAIKFMKDLKPTEYVVAIDIFMPPYRYAQENKATKVTTTIPMWLKSRADNANLNYSSLLQSAIKETLKIGESAG